MSQEEYITTIFNRLQEAILVIDRDYRIVDVNDSACTITQRSREEIIGTHCYKISHLMKGPCFESGTQCPVKEVLETRQKTHVIHKHFSADNTTRWEEIIASPLIKEDGTITHVIEEIRDCTELLKHQEVIKDLKSEIKTLQGMLPMCASCKKIRNDEGYWENVEEYISKTSDAVFTHGLCPTCAEKLYPDYYKK